VDFIQSYHYVILSGHQLLIYKPFFKRFPVSLDDIETVDLGPNVKFVTLVLKGGRHVRIDDDSVNLVDLRNFFEQQNIPIENKI